MTPQDFQAYLQLQQRIITLLERMALALEQMIPTLQAPNYQFDLKDYGTFNWASIGATVADFDSDGATAIHYRNHTYLRRSPSNKFDAAIWFSRCVGRDEQGANKYERLITFKAKQVPEQLPKRVTSAQRLG